MKPCWITAEFVRISESADWTGLAFSVDCS